MRQLRAASDARSFSYPRPSYLAAVFHFELVMIFKVKRIYEPPEASDVLRI